MGTPVVRVGEVMQRELRMVGGLATVEEALAAMREHGVNSLIVERRSPDDAFGIVTMRDIADRAVAPGKPLGRTAVYEVMTKPALTVSAAMNVRYALRLLTRLGFGRALVTEGEELVGIVTLRDLVMGFARAGSDSGSDTSSA